MKSNPQEVRSYISEKYGIDQFTCDDCTQKETCPCAFDAYNTDGDCLMEK